MGSQSPRQSWFHQRWRYSAPSPTCCKPALSLTLSSAVSAGRRAPLQLTLSFLQPPPRPEAVVWTRLTEQQRQAVVAKLAMLIAKAARTTLSEEQGDD